MEWYDLRVNVVKKESKEASAFTPVVGTTVYFNLLDKGYYNIASGSAVTNAKGAAILLRDYFSGQTSINNLNAAEYWDAYIYYKDKGIPTAVMPISENNATITIIEKAENTWNELSVYVGRDNGSEVVPVIDNTVNFYLNRKNSARPTILSGVTNKLGYAFAQNNGTYNDTEYWSASTVYSSTTYSSRTYDLPTEKGEIIFSGGAKQSVHKLTVYTTYNKNPIIAYVACFLFVNDSASYLRLTGNTEIADGVARIDFNIDGVSYEYQNFDYVKLNAYNGEFKVAYIGVTQMIPELDTETGGYFLNVELTLQSAYYGKIAKKVHSCDLLYKYITNGGKLGVYPWTFVAKKGSGGNVIYCFESTSAYTSNSSNPTTFTSDTPYMKFYSHPTDTTYSSAYTDVNLINYVYENNAHQIGNVYIFCPKITTLKIENPVVLDTVPYDLDSPVYNLPDVSITYNYIRGGTVAWSATSSSNDLYTIFNLSDIPGGTAEFLKTLAGGNSNRIERVLSKHHYVDNTTYAFISASTVPVHHAYSAYPYNGHFLYFCKYIMNGNQPTLFMLPQRYVYIEREADVCYTSDMFNDYVQGFDYNYSGNVITAITASTNEYYERDRGLVLGSGSGYPCVSAFTILPSNKLIVATHGFYNSCATKVSPQISPIPSAVAEYKSSFVNRAITRTEYYTIYANKPSDTMVYNDAYFDPNDANFSGHAYNEHMQSFWPHEGKWWNYLEFFPTGNTSGTVKLQAVAIQNEDIIKTLEYSYWGDRWTHYDIGQVIELYPGTNVRFRNSENVTTFSPGVDNGIDRYYVFIVTGEKMCVKGNLSSLINVSGMGFTVTGDYSFMKLFYDSKIYDAENLRVDPTIVSDGCYYRMFQGSTNMKKGPKAINAAVGGEACMGHMFDYCINMESGPLRIRLREYERLCCDHMFSECYKLVYPPLFTYNIESNTFGEACFGQMFLDCTSLREPTGNPDQVYFIEYINEHPERDGYGCAWQLGDTVGGLVVGLSSCYEMFKGCSSLEGTPTFHPYIINDYGCYSTFSACTSLTSVKFSMPFENTPVGEYGCAYMFNNCWSITTLHNVALSATTLSAACYYHMFEDCHKLAASLPLIKATTIPVSGCAYMYHRCYKSTSDILKPLNQFITTDFSTVYEYGMAHMFEECTFMDINIGRRDLYYNNHKLNMRWHKNAIQSVYDAHIDLDDTYSYYGDLWVKLNQDDGPEKVGKVDMFGPYYVEKWNLPNSYEFRYEYNYIYLNAVSLHTGCYSYMFADCDNLHYSSHIVLSANVLSDLCYDHMFYSCDRLFSIPLCFSGITSFAPSACQYMFAFDGDFAGNNNIRNQISTSYWSLQNSNFNYINMYGSTSGYDLEYYIHKEGLRNVQKYYNYYYNIYGTWTWPYNLENNFASFSKANNKGLNYSGRTRMSYCLVDVSDSISTQSNKIVMHGGSASFLNARNCFDHMFFGCKGLKNVQMTITNGYVRDSMFKSMFNCCYSLVTPPLFALNQINSSNSVGELGYASMFKDCHEMTTLGCYQNTLSATTIGKNAYNKMYQGCYKIWVGPNIRALSMGEGAMGNMFAYCYRLVQIGSDSTTSKLPSTTLNKNCYAGMFSHCFSLVTAPKLPATTLSAGCYSWMFSDDCLYYYTGRTGYKIENVLRASDIRNLPSTANGKCNIAGYTAELSEDDYWDFITKQDDWVTYYRYCGNYFYCMSYDTWDSNAIDAYAPFPFYGSYTPYTQLGGKRYLREETDIPEDPYYPPHVGTLNDFLNIFDGYYSTTGSASRHVISPNHVVVYKKNGTSWPSRTLLCILKEFVPEHTNTHVGYKVMKLVVDGNGFYNEKYNANDLLAQGTYPQTYKKVSGSSYVTVTENLPIFLNEDEVEELDDELNAYNHSVEDLYEIYRVRGRYVTTAITQQPTDAGYSLNMYDNTYYKENKEIRDSRWFSYYNAPDEIEGFFIPVNDRPKWDRCLSAIYLSATTVNGTYCSGWTNMLNLTGGTIYLPQGSTIVNGSDGLPGGWHVQRT